MTSLQGVLFAVEPTLLLYSAITFPSMTDANPLVALLGPLLQGATNLNSQGTFPFQQSGFEAAGDAKFFFKSWLLADLPGLVQQCRGALLSDVKSLRCTLRKVPDADITWRVFICSDDDLDASNFSPKSLVDFLRCHPHAVPQYTIKGDTTQSTLTFECAFPLGIGRSVAFVLPPLQKARLLVYLEADNGSIKDKAVHWSWSGEVEITGFGYVAPRVAGP
jgi:hypothetical protein